MLPKTGKTVPNRSGDGCAWQSYTAAIGAALREELGEFSPLD